MMELFQHHQGGLMSFTTSITENIRKEAEKLIEMVNGEISQDKTAHEIENQLWWELMAMGQQLMQLFFTTHEEQEVQQKVRFVYFGEHVEL